MAPIIVPSYQSKLGALDCGPLEQFNRETHHLVQECDSRGYLDVNTELQVFKQSNSLNLEHPTLINLDFRTIGHETLTCGFWPYLREKHQVSTVGVFQALLTYIAKYMLATGFPGTILDPISWNSPVPGRK